jgi:hypothetical protein
LKEGPPKKNEKQIRIQQETSIVSSLVYWLRGAGVAARKILWDDVLDVVKKFETKVLTQAEA